MQRPVVAVHARGVAHAHTSMRGGPRRRHGRHGSTSARRFGRCVTGTMPTPSPRCQTTAGRTTPL